MSDWTPVLRNPVTHALKLKALIYGGAGVGKTTLAASASTCENMSPVLYITVEGGEMSITESLPHLGIDIDKIQFTTFANMAELSKLITWLNTAEHPFKTVVLDSLTELQAGVVETYAKLYIPRSETGIPNTEADKRMWQKIYGKATEMLREKCRAFRDLPCHVIFIAHDKENEETKKIAPALMPAFTKSLEGYLDEVWYLFMRSSKEDEAPTRNILTQPTPRVTAKDRSPGGKLGRVMENPTMRTIYTKLTTKAVSE